MTELINIKVTDTTREDLTEFGESELSLRVFNEEWLYDMRRYSSFKDILEEYYIFDQAQWDELENDLEIDRGE